MKFIEPSFEILSKDFKRENVLTAIECAARTCYKSEDKITNDSAERLVRSLVKRGHEAMLEHAPTLSVRFICDRGVSHELVRHRLFSFAQESTRYVDYNNTGTQFIIPEWIKGKDRETILNFKYKSIDELNDNIESIMNTFEDKKNWWFVSVCMFSDVYYRSLIETGWKPQQARTVLTNSIKTEIVVTGNVREWRNFFKLRLDRAAHPQMRELTIPLFRSLYADIPEIWEDIADRFNIL